VKQRFHFLREGSPEARHPREPLLYRALVDETNVVTAYARGAGPVLTTKKQWVKIDAKMEKGEGIFEGRGVQSLVVTVIEVAQRPSQGPSAT
jgi:hypothetical protein